MHTTTERDLHREFDGLCHQHYDWLKRQARRYQLQDVSWSQDDLVQETMLRAWPAFAEFDGRNPRGWLSTIMSHTFINVYRRWQVRQEVDGALSLQECPVPPENMQVLTDSRTADAALLERVISEEMQRAVQALREPYVGPTIMALVHGYDYEEIARHTGTPLNTVRTRVHRGRRLMQKVG